MKSRLSLMQNGVRRILASVGVGCCLLAMVTGAKAQSAVTTTLSNVVPASCVSSNDPAVGTVAWTNPANARTSNNQRASASLPSGQTSHYLKCSGFNFSIPGTATIDSMTVRIERSASSSGAIRDAYVQMIRAGTVEGTPNYGNLTTNYGGSESTVNYTVNAASWTPSDLNDSNFGIAFAARNNNNSNARTAYVDSIRITVVYTDYCPPPSNAPSGLALTCVCDKFDRTDLNPSPINNAYWILDQKDDTSGGRAPGLPTILNNRLQLTPNDVRRARVATVPSSFPAAGNYISIDFNHYAYSSNNNSDGRGDGMAVILSDSRLAPLSGSYGGSLGYAQKVGSDCALPGGNCPGFQGGWIGVGFDEYGGFQSASEGRIGGPGRVRQSVSVRGSGSGMAGYAWLDGTNTQNTYPIDVNSSTIGRGYRYQVIVDARNAASNSTTVRVNRDTSGVGNDFDAMLTLNNIFTTANAQGAPQAVVPPNWLISFTGSTGSATNNHLIDSLRICAQTIQPLPGNVAEDFSVIDEAYGTPPVGPTSEQFVDGHIYMKIVGVPFKLNVAAMKDDAILQSYVFSGTKDVTVKLVDNQNDICKMGQEDFCNAACQSAPAVSGGEQVLTFESSDQGKKLSTDFTINTAYRNLVAVVSDAAGTTACSIDAFSVRPAGFVAVQTSNATQTGLPPGAPVFKASIGKFHLKATTIGVAGVASGYNGQPKINNAVLQAGPSGAGGTLIAGGVSPTVFPMATPGIGASIAEFADFTYSEVGTFTVPGYDPGADATTPRGVYDGVHATECGATLCSVAEKDTRKTSTWTGVDSVSSKGDCVDESYANTKNASGQYGCLFGATGSQSFGRFIPDHFALLSDGALVPACEGTSDLTYMGQPFAQLKFTLEAQNAAGGKTQNYLGSLATAVPVIVAENEDKGVDWGTRVGGVPAASWTAGTYGVDTNAATFIRPQTCTGSPLVCTNAAPDGPFDGLQLGVKVKDDVDGVTTISDVDMNAETTGACGAGCNSKTIGNVTKVRFGRLRLLNAHGSEKLNLPIPVRVQYWNGSQFVTNTLDNCTMIANANVALSNYQSSRPAPAVGITPGNMPLSNVQVGVSGTSTFENGVGRLMLRRPVSPLPTTRGSVDVCIDLGADTVPGTTCAATSANMPWLKWAWGGILFDDDPQARATFGVYKSEFIYIREMY